MFWWALRLVWVRKVLMRYVASLAAQARWRLSRGKREAAEASLGPWELGKRCWWPGIEISGCDAGESCTMVAMTARGMSDGGWENSG